MGEGLREISPSPFERKKMNLLINTAAVLMAMIGLALSLLFTVFAIVSASNGKPSAFLFVPMCVLFWVLYGIMIRGFWKHLVPKD